MLVTRYNRVKGIDMAPPCKVCAHPQRAEIDRALALQVCNQAEVSRRYAVSHDSVQRHRQQHLPTFLAAFAGDTEALAPGTIRAEAERLYLVSLDALAAAQSGVLVAVDSDGNEHRRVSMSSVARLIAEARKGLDLLATLAAASGGAEIAPAGVNLELDTRIAAALDRVAARAQLSSGVVDAEVVEEGTHVFSPMSTPHGDGGAGAASHVTPGGGAADPPPASRASEGPSFSATSLGHPGVQNGQAEEGVPEPEALVREPVWEGNPAASPEERKAQGFEVLPVKTARREYD